MDKPLTTIRLTKGMRYIENALIKETGMNKKGFHRKAYESYIAGDHTIDDQLKITKRKDPDYISKSVTEQTFIDDDIKLEMKKIAREQGVKYSTVLCQAITNYCIELSPMLPDGMIDAIIEEY